MKKLIFILIFVSTLFTESCLNCGEPLLLEANFIPKRKTDNALLVGSQGQYPTDSLRLFWVRFQNSDTFLIDVTNTSFDKSNPKDSILGIELNENAYHFLLSYGSLDNDTIVFNVRKKGRKSCHGYAFDFFYNGQEICTNCNSADTHIIKK